MTNDDIQFEVKKKTEAFRGKYKELQEAIANLKPTEVIVIHNVPNRQAASKYRRMLNYFQMYTGIVTRTYAAYPDLIVEKV